MIKITVVSYNNQRPLDPLSAIFGRDGGTLGRSEENFFVLPDAKHLVSRVQASVSSDGQRHLIVSLSEANPVVLNGSELPFKQEHAFRPGDEIQVGPYVLIAETHLAAVGEPTVQNLSVIPPVLPDQAPGAVGEAGSTPAETKVLLDAFLQGAGIPTMSVGAGLTPEFMETVGKLLAATLNGTYQLVSARALSKREVKADVTMVVVRNNNPLKFLPDSQAVLMQMLRKKMPGFMGPVEAVQDAFDDLQLHQKGTMAGMHGVFEELLRRLDPEAIEAGTSAPTTMEKLAPSKRTARMWEQAKMQYEQTCREARGDFQRNFGNAFVLAYEAEVERLQDIDPA